MGSGAMNVGRRPRRESMIVGSYALLVMAEWNGVGKASQPLHHKPPLARQTHAPRDCLNVPRPCRADALGTVASGPCPAVPGDQSPGLERARPRTARRTSDLVSPDWLGDHAARKNLLRKRSIFARPHIDRFSMFNRV